MGWSELFGGAAAVVVVVVEARSLRNPDVPWWALLAGLGFGVSSALAGQLLLRDRPSGRLLSIAVQSAQVLRIVVDGFAWRAAAGVTAMIWYSAPGGWDGILGATAMFRAASPTPTEWEIGVNLFALLALHKLRRMPSTVGRTPPLSPPTDEERGVQRGVHREARGA